MPFSYLLDLVQWVIAGLLVSPLLSFIPRTWLLGFLGKDTASKNIIRSHPSVPLHASCRDDTLCASCTALDLSPRKFVVLPGDKEYGTAKKDSETISRFDFKFGTIEDIIKNKSCPLCRLTCTVTGADKIPALDHTDTPITIVANWRTTGPRIAAKAGQRVNPDAEPMHRPVLRYLVVAALNSDRRTLPGDFMPWKQMWLLYDDVATADPAVTPNAKDYSVCTRKSDAIDFDLVRRRIANCKEQHSETCGADHTYIDDEDLADFLFIDVERQCLTHIRPGTEYAALSYIWGPRNFFKTTRAAVAELERPGALSLLGEHLPFTIRDAILVTQKVGMRYLWVDTLCIIQDDADLKMKMIMMMDEVYGGASLVIQAAGSSDAYAGIAGIQPAGTNQRPRQVLEQIAPGFRLVCPDTALLEYSSMPYNRRAWTFQEARLASEDVPEGIAGIVYDTSLDVCPSAAPAVGQPRKSEGKTTTETAEDDQKPPITAKGPYSGNYATVMPAGVSITMFQLEGALVEYSKRQLSYSSDLYIAFVGICQQLRWTYKTDFCHGLPTRVFDWALLWQPQPKSNMKRWSPSSSKPPGVRGPSWSSSGWTGEGIIHNIHFTYSNNIDTVSRGIRLHTWIVWYQRQAHDSVECRPLVVNPFPDKSNNDDETRSQSEHTTTQKQEKDKDTTLNMYGAPRGTSERFPGLDCSRTSPTSIVFREPNDPSSVNNATDTNTNASKSPPWPVKYLGDVTSQNPGSGFLQFWTVSIQLQMCEMPHPPLFQSVESIYPDLLHFSLVGKSGRVIGSVSVQPEWLITQRELNGSGTLPQTREFLVICEARDRKLAVKGGDPELPKEAWLLRVMLVEWVTPDEKRWIQGRIGTVSSGAGIERTGPAHAERVAMGYIEMGAVNEALGNGPEWKEIILG